MSDLLFLVAISPAILGLLVCNVWFTVWSIGLEIEYWKVVWGNMDKHELMLWSLTYSLAGVGAWTTICTYYLLAVDTLMCIPIVLYCVSGIHLRISVHHYVCGEIYRWTYPNASDRTLTIRQISATSVACWITVNVMTFYDFPVWECEIHQMCLLSWALLLCNLTGLVHEVYFGYIHWNNVIRWRGGDP